MNDKNRQVVETLQKILSGMNEAIAEDLQNPELKENPTYPVICALTVLMTTAEACAHICTRYGVPKELLVEQLLKTMGAKTMRLTAEEAQELFNHGKPAAPGSVAEAERATADFLRRMTRKDS